MKHSLNRTLVVIIAVVAVSSLALASLPAQADDAPRCSKDRANPTVLDVDRPLRVSTVSIATRKGHGGARPAIKVVEHAGGKRSMQSTFVYKKTLMRCFWRNSKWTVEQE